MSQAVCNALVATYFKFVILFCFPMAHTKKSVFLRFCSRKSPRKDNVEAHCQGYA